MISKTIWPRAVVAVFIFLFFVATAHSKPMPEPTLDEAIEHSEYIVIVEYLKFMKGTAKVDYFSGLEAVYNVIKVLKGGTLNKTVSIRYDFSDGSECLEPAGWVFNDQTMPQKGSRWILFLESKDHAGKVWKTYRGDYGRWEYAEPNLLQITNELKR